MFFLHISLNNQRLHSALYIEHETKLKKGI